MTLQQFRDDLVEALGRGDLTPEKLDRWIHASMSEFGYAFKFHALEASARIVTVPGKEVYALGEDFRAMHEDGVMIVEPIEIKGKLLAEARATWKLYRAPSDDTQCVGIPTYYHMFNGKMYLRDIPDSEYTIEYDYWRKIPRLIVADDTSVFDEDWDDIIFTGALYRGFRAYGEFDRYKNVRNDFIGMIRSRVMDEDLQEFPEGGISLAQSPDDYVSR